MPEVIVCPSEVAKKMQAAYQTTCTYSMSCKQFTDMFLIDVRSRINDSLLSDGAKLRLLHYAEGQLDAFVHVISTEHCEVVCKGADGAIHKGANSAGTGLRWKGTDFLFTPIEVQP